MRHESPGATPAQDAAARSEGRDGRLVTLRLLATTDLHAHLHGYDYHRDREIDTAGLVRTASLIRTARDEVPGAVLLDNGDFLQGTPLGDVHAEDRGAARAGPHPVVEAMSTLGFDAVTIGNHDFDYGLDFLQQAMRGARFPAVLANVAQTLGERPEDDDTLFAPFTLIRRALRGADGDMHEIRVGVIGFTPPQIMQWNGAALQGRCAARGVVETARAWIPQMRAAGADIVVALSHGGFGAPGDPGGENASADLAALEGIDAVIAGHVHAVFPSMGEEPHPAADSRAGTVHGTPAVMAGLWGSHLGVIDLGLVHEGGHWRIASSRSEARPIAARDTNGLVVPLTDDDATLSELIAPAHARTLRATRRTAGHSPVCLHSYFAAIGVDPAARAVMRAQAWAVREALAGTPDADLPVLSAASALKTGGRGGPDYYTDIAPGPMTMRDLADLYQFSNTVLALRLTGADLRHWLERAASVFNRIAPGDRDVSLLDPDHPLYLLDAIDGLDYRVDLTAAPRFDVRGDLRDTGAWRIGGLSYRGRPVMDGDRFILACNSHRGLGGGRFPGSGSGNLVLETGEPMRDVILRFVSAGGLDDLPTGPLFRMAAPPGTSVVFRSGPGALAHLPVVPLDGLTELGRAPDGFMRFRLSF